MHHFSLSPIWVKPVIAVMLLALRRDRVFYSETLNVSVPLLSPSSM
jgi:hypothetical protein